MGNMLKKSIKKVKNQGTEFDFNSPYQQKVVESYGLNQRNYTILIEGDYVEYGIHEQDLKEAEDKVIYELLWNKWEASKIIEIFEKHVHPESYYKSLGENYLQEVKKRIEETADFIKNKKSDLNEIFNRIENNFPNFTGRNRTTERAVYKYILKKARETGKTEGLALACRDVANGSGVGTDTAGRILNSLLEQGYIEKSKQSIGVRASEYSLVINVSDEKNSTSTNDGIDIFSNYMNHDVFAHRGLSKKGLLIWEFFIKANRAIIYKEIRSETKITKNCIFEKLNRMLELKMISKNGVTYSIGEKFYDLDDAAKTLGTNGKGKTKKERIELERASRHNAIREFKLFRENTLYDKESREFVNVSTGEIIEFSELRETFEKFQIHSELQNPFQNGH